MVFIEIWIGNGREDSLGEGITCGPGPNRRAALITGQTRQLGNN